MRAFYRILPILLLLTAQVFSSGKVPGQSSAMVVLDFPISGYQHPATWMSAPVSEWESPGGYRVEIPVAPLDAEERLVVSAIFLEHPSSELSVVWDSDAPGADSMVLAEELGQGILGWNQRAFVIPPELASGGGMVVIESRGTERVLFRLICTLLAEGKFFTAEHSSDSEVYGWDGDFFTASELDPAEWKMPPDAWSGNRIDAYLQEAPEPIREGLEFALEIRPAPERTLLHFVVNGPMATPDIWVNGTKLDGVSVVVPGFRSPGYVQPEPGGDYRYAGWRKGWVLLPPGLLQPGENSFVFHSGGKEVFLAKSKLEMWFEAPLLPTPSPEFPDITESLSLPLSEPGPDASGEWEEPPLPKWQGDASTEEEQPLPSPAQLFRTSLQ